MEIEDVHSIIKQNDNFQNCLQSFITKTEKSFVFPELDENGLRIDLWRSLYKIASNTSDYVIQANCCSAVRILSREKKNLNEILKSTEWLDLLKKFSNLNDITEKFNEKTKEVAIEALKCLCNLVFNSNEAARQCIDNSVLYNINDRIKYYSDPEFPEEVKFYDVKLIFIISAVRQETRKILRDEKDAVTNLIEFLDFNLKDENIHDDNLTVGCEILKALFNLTIDLKPKDEQIVQYKNMVKILRKCLLLPGKSEKYRFLQNHVVELLTNIPNDFYADLIKSSSFEDSEEYDMRAFEVIIELLKLKVEVNHPIGRQLEIICPTATVLYKGASSNRNIRKYLRTEILPPLKDFQNRPEEGSTLRNYLCRLLTSPNTHLKDIIAELLFVLCKKNVKRMIKYTGFGNAAGLLAQRGLLGGKDDKEAAEFSSDSENSETEEYADNKHNINPVLGCLEQSHRDVMAGMTDEQKEDEAMKLVNLMDALTRRGTIKPCRIDENGKPVPISHVLELQSSLKKKEQFDVPKE